MLEKLIYKIIINHIFFKGTLQHIGVWAGRFFKLNVIKRKKFTTDSHTYMELDD
jgi:hypothetical protein